METLKNKSGITFNTKVLKACTFFFILMLFAAIEAVAQVNLEEEKAKAAQNELLSYVFMGIGFALVMFIAIYTSIKGKKNKNEGDIHKPVSHRPFSHKHDHHHGRRGTQLSRK